jgi:hypothetical protein
MSSMTRFAALCQIRQDRALDPIYTIGLIMLDKMDTRAPDAFAAVVKLSKSVAPNWG